VQRCVCACVPHLPSPHPCPFAVLNVGAREEPTPEEVRLAYDTTDVLLLDDPTARLSPALKIALPAINKASTGRHRLQARPHYLLCEGQSSSPCTCTHVP
jgi:hypothetical protein